MHPNLFQSGGVGFGDRDDPPIVNHRDPVGELEDLIEVLGHQQDRRAPVPLLDQTAPDILGGCDVESPCRLVRNDHVTAGRRVPCAMMIFCRLPPESVLVVCDADGVWISNLSMDSAAKASIWARLRIPALENCRSR